MNTDESIEVIVVGAGPCGLSVGVAAARAGIDCVLFDKGCITRSITLYPIYGTFFSTSDKLELGGLPFITTAHKPTRPEALKYYRRVVSHFDLDVRQYEEVVSVEGQEGNFTVHTRQRGDVESSYHASRIVVATGYFDTPNMLDVPGEELDKTTHYFTEGLPYYDQDCIVVGAGNSAAEAVLDLYRSGARVTLVHFLDRLDEGIKPWILPDIENRIEKAEVGVRWNTRIVEIRPRSVVLRREDTGQTEEVPNDVVFAMTGWTPEPALLRRMDVALESETNIPEHDPETLETNRPGVYIAGVLAAGANKTFIENGRKHGGRIIRAIERKLASR